MWRRANSRHSDTDTASLQSDVFGSFDAGGLANRYSLGLEASRERTNVQRYKVSPNKNPASGCLPGLIGDGQCTSLGAPSPRDPWYGSARLDPATRTRTQGRTLALYAMNTVELSPRWQLNLGTRLDRFSTEARDSATRVSHTSQFWNGQAGIVFKPAPEASLYLSWATSATPVGGLVGEGSETNPLAAANVHSELQPEQTVNHELGGKWDLAGGDLALAGAVFHTVKRNTRVLVGNDTYRNAGTSCPTCLGRAWCCGAPMR